MVLFMHRKWLAAGLLVLMANATSAWADEPGLDDLNEATRQKIAAENIEDLTDVVEHLEAAIEKGLEQENADYAKQMLMSTLMQRATTYASAIFSVPAQDPRAGVQVMQLRQFAVNDLQRIIDMEDKAWDAHILMGRLHALSLGDPGAARRSYTAVIDAADAPAENRAEALALRSGVQRDPQRQADDLNRAVELQPEKPDYYRLRAQSRYAEDKFDEALSDIERAVKLDAEHAASHELRGMILLGMERYEDALASFDRATELEPESARPYQYRSELFRKQGDATKAVEQLSKAIEIAPSNVALLLLRAGIYFEMKETEKSLADVDQAIRAQPQFLQPHLMRAEIHAATDQLDKAIADLERLLQLAPGQKLLLTQLGSFYMRAERPSKAIEILNQALKLDPDNFPAVRLRADAYLNVGQHGDAINDFKHALELQPDEDSSLLNNYAWVLATSPSDELRDGKRAIELATRACEAADYETPHILSTLAAAYAESGDFPTAIKWAEKAVELSGQAIEKAETDAERAALQTQHEQLKQELASYQEKKPWRERQSAEEKDSSKPADDQSTTSPVEQATVEKRIGD